MTVAIVVSTGFSPALAQNNEAPGTTPELDQANELGHGSCSPDSLAVDQVTTCTFPLIGATRLSGLFPVHAYVIGQEDLRSGRCVISGDRLVCPDLPVGYDRGPLSIAVDFAPEQNALAEISVDRTHDGVLGLSIVSLRVTPAFVGVPTRFQVFRSSSLAQNATADLLLRREGDDTVVARAPALSPGEQYGFAELTIPEPGRWTLTGCVNGPSEECVKEGIRRPVQAIAPDPLPLVEGHNDVSADRINLVFVGSGFDDPTRATLVETATRLLSLDGEPEVYSDAGGPYALGWGPFSVEPIRGNVDRFNFWYLEGDLPSIDLLVDPSTTESDTMSVDSLGLGPDVILVGLTRNSSADSDRAHAALPSWADNEVVDLPDMPSLGSIYLPVFDDDPSVAGTLTHELGHALFGLRDEYDRFGSDVGLPGYPNCLTDRVDAETYWGDLLGQLDPMYERWKSVSEANGVWYETDLAKDEFRVDVVDAYCAGDEVAGFRPTQRGLMNFEEPVFGAVNRRRAEQILDLWPQPVVVTTTTVAPTTTTSSTSASTAAATQPSGSESASGPVSTGRDSSGTATNLPIIGGLVAIAAAAISVVRLRERD